LLAVVSEKKNHKLLGAEKETIKPLIRKIHMNENKKEIKDGK